MRSKKSVAVTMCFCTLLLFTGALRAQKDPGPRGGAAAAGGAFPTLNDKELGFFNQTAMRFLEVDSVSGTIPGEDGTGLGPTFNGNSCAQCHAQPAIGGSSPGLTSPQNLSSQSASGSGHFGWSHERRSLLHHRQRAGARSSLRAQPQWHAGWRRPWLVHHCRAERCGWLQHGPAQLRPGRLPATM